MTSGGEVLTWARLESSGLQLAGTYLLSCLVIRPEGMRRLGAIILSKFDLLLPADGQLVLV